MKGIRLDILTICLSVICAAAIIGYCVVNSVKIISDTIAAKEISISEESISKLAKELAKAMPQAAGRAPGRRSQAAGRAERPTPGSKKVEGVTAKAKAIKGNPKAKVLIVEFSDFQCPFSKRFYSNAYPAIEREYISTGKVKFAYRHFPLGFHPQAKIAAMAYECAGKQGKYWEMFDKLINSSSLELDALKGLGKEISLNTKAFNNCLDKEETKQKVENDFSEAGKFGVNGTPAFFINGRLVEGAMPFEVFKKIIEEELVKTK